MENFEFYSPTRFVFGRGAENKVGALVRKCGGTKVLLHFGGGSIKANGIYGKVVASLEAAGLEFVELGGVMPNPRSGLVREGIELCRREKVDFVLAVGGGSVIDSAKAIAFGVLYDGDFADFYFGKDVKAMMTGSGMALMGCGKGEGENRIKDAVTGALASPLLNDFDIKTAKNVLLNVTAGYNEKGLLMEDLAKIDKLLEEEFGENANRFKRGIVYETDQDFGDKVKITVIATGFEMKRLNDIANVKLGNIIMIDSDFEYTTEVALNAEEEDSKEKFSQKIGFNNVTIKKTLNLRGNSTPALLVGEKDAKGPLESIAAIRRREK